MRKAVESWTVERLREQFTQISFPEYQREPNLWTLVEKQRLIDSMVREFDIASLYLYEHSDGSMDCVDGRQRIGSIMSFVGDNTKDPNNRFPLRILNEIYPEDEPLFQSLEGLSYREILESIESNRTAKDFVDRLSRYSLTVVKLFESDSPEEFNLQFTRLNLGTIINSGEKLNAMVGELRNACFDEDGLGSHPFLEETRIPTRRFAREQTAAQILAQVFSFSESGEYARTRHFDLQRLFKQYGTLDPEKKRLIDSVSELFDLLHDAFSGSAILRNRAVTVSTVLLGWLLEVRTPADATKLANFMTEFQCRLNWQVQKGLNADAAYHYLIGFQRHLTQASVEKPAVAARAQTLREEYMHWSQSQELQGDAEWKRQNPDRDPSVECRSVG